jgi:hypothetical protein
VSPLAPTVTLAPSQLVGEVTFHVQVAGLGSTLSPSSTARTWKVCWPIVRFEKLIGLRHSTASQSPKSMRHSYSISDGSVESSVAEKPNTAVLRVLGLVGFDVRKVCGGVMSSPPMKLWTSGVGSTLPLRSTARTSSLFGPSSSWSWSPGQGLLQPYHMNSGSSGSGGSVGSTGSGGSVASWLRTRHSKVSSSAGVTLSVPENRNLAVSPVCVGLSSAITVCGGTESGGGNGPSNSCAPLSQRPFCGREIPRASRSGQRSGLPSSIRKTASTPPSTAKEPIRGAWVMTMPPLSARASSSGSTWVRSRGPAK